MSPLTPPEDDRAPGDRMTPNPKPAVNQSPGSAANNFCPDGGERKGATPQPPPPQSPTPPVEPPAAPRVRPVQRPLRRDRLRAALPLIPPLALPQPNAREPLEGCVLAEMIRVRGTVQGVGFRPTAYRLARDCGLKGQIWNDGRGVSIRAAGSAIALQTFVRRLRQEAPPLAHIEAIERSPLSLDVCEWSEFAIVASRQGRPKTHIAADAATCDRCREDLFDPASRYYRYPFVNCTHCGPRLSVIQGLPYDRAQTTMAVFPLCGGCKAAYHSPSDRRFHAQPVACRECGPKIWLERSGEAQAIAVGEDPESVTALLDRVRAALAAGAIVAIKGLGGFHLVCDGTHGAAVDTLRRRKGRPDKPLALMGRSLEVLQNYCQVTAAERMLLLSPRSPIVLLDRRDRLDPSVRPVAEAVAPHQTRLGFMVPYTPLHHLLFETLDHPLVFTSGNASGKPQCIDNGEARQDLGAIADWFILHDRDITHPLDDSVVRFWTPATPLHDPAPQLDPGTALGPASPDSDSDSGPAPDPDPDPDPDPTQAQGPPEAQPLILRRGRGYAPEPLILPPGFEAAPPVLALGGELKAAFGFVRQGRLVLSQYLGNLGNSEAFAAYWRTLDHYLGVFDLQPTAIAFDCHPDYRTTTLGRDLAVATGRPTYAIQHHHAHGAACLADNGVPLDAPPSLAIAFDGLGYGTDGTLWGGEFLWMDYRQSRRLACLRPFPALGGDRAAQQPWRNAYVQLHQAKLLDRFLALGDRVPLVAHLRQQPLETLDRVVTTGLGSPLTSSMGRLFDAIAAAAGLAIESCSYEGQAAQLLEGAAVRYGETLGDSPENLAPAPYPFGLMAGRAATADPLLYLDPAPLWAALLTDLETGATAELIAWRFHQGLAVAIAAIAAHLQGTSPTTPFSQVLLTGGTFQNVVLTIAVAQRLRSLGLTVLTHRQVPANDGGLALGQAAIAAAHLL
ncbi:MAG: carbamoyltransferase HypF [Cyanobacteria bacterium]|nr:carbamoyltransferase HypF [Cyanobacteriota bacterium]